MRCSSAGSAGAADDLAHQHEKRDDRQRVTANSVIGCRAEYRQGNAHIAVAQIDPDYAREPQGDADMHAGQYEYQQDDQRIKDDLRTHAVLYLVSATEKRSGIREFLILG